MATLSADPNVKRLHDAENEIACVESKIQMAALNGAYPHEFTEMRTEQERHRQNILKCKTEIDACLPELLCADEHR